MPWDSGSGGSVTAAVPHQTVPPPQFSPAAESAYPIVPPAGSSGQSPRQRRRTTSTGSSSDSLVRQSLEFDSQPQQQQQQQQQPRLGSGGMSTRTMLFSQQQTLGITSRQLSTGFTTSTGDNFNDGAAEQLQSDGGGKSSSGPIMAHPSLLSSPASGGPASASSAASQQSDFNPTIVKRTHSLKDDLIKRVRSKFAGNRPSSEHQIHQQQLVPQQQQLQQRQQQQQQQQQQLTRSRPGSLRNTPSPSAAAAVSAAAAAGSGPGSVVVKVLPDKKLINKASSSENLSPGGVGSCSAAAASDLNSLTSLVQRKRDRSQDSADSSNGSPPRRPAHIRKAPAPPPPSQAASQPLQVMPTPFTGDAIEEAPASMTACKAKPPSGRQRHLPSEDSSEPEDCRSRDSPVEEPTAHGPDSSGGSGAVLGHHRSNSLEFLQDAVQSRTAPKIRQPSAIRKISDSGQQAHQQRDPSPCGKASLYGSSPPKTVSFNPNDEILTYEGAPPSRKSSHHRQVQQPSRHQQSKLGDNALIEIHSTMVDMMESIVNHQRQILTKVQSRSISVASYRDSTKTLLAAQTRTIQQILDAIQANEKA